MLTRRQLLKSSTALAGGAALAHAFPGVVTSLSGLARYQQGGGAPADPVAAMRAQMGSIPIETVRLADNLTMLAGPGGNVVVLNGPDGKVVVDGFVQTAWAGLKKVLDGMGSGPIRLLVNTHWHFDHTDNNGNFAQAGAVIVAHANTRTRMMQPHDMLGMRFNPSPESALPVQTFAEVQRMHINGENVELRYIPPAHTDTDLHVLYPKANVLHLGDVFFNGTYPFIDAGTGGSINGTIAGVERALKIVNGGTRIVPGHGPVANRAALGRYRDVLSAVRDRVSKLKASGRTLEQVVAAKPSAAYDATWGKGFMMPDNFVAIVYTTL
jgi:glyoxylase-like metal-dependent hydrolase (beta-lactamase superfamily II)